jgi:DNA-binding beta-propeller fold protein YncE
LIALAVASSARAQAVGAYAVTKTLKIGGPGSWDYVTVDSMGQRLYLTRTTHTMVVDAASGKVLADIPGQKRAHGVALVPQAGRGFITDGQEGTVTIFDLKTNEVLGKIAAADDADGIIYDPASDRVLVSCGDANVLVAIRPEVDPKSGKAEQVQLGGKPEFLAADGAGKVFVNLVDKAEVAVVDTKSMKLLARWPVTPAAQPVGLAIDPAKHHLFVGCRSRNLIVMSTSDGHILANLPIGAVNDACAFDPATGDIFASCGDGTVTIARETSAGKFEIAQKLETRRGAKTMGLDPSTHTAYLPAVEYEEGAQANTRRAPAKPDSFMVLVATPTK